MNSYWSMRVSIVFWLVMATAITRLILMASPVEAAPPPGEFYCGLYPSETPYNSYVQVWGVPAFVEDFTRIWYDAEGVRSWTTEEEIDEDSCLLSVGEPISAFTIGETGREWTGGSWMRPFPEVEVGWTKGPCGTSLSIRSNYPKTLVLVDELDEVSMPVPPGSRHDHFSSLDAAHFYLIRDDGHSVIDFWWQWRLPEIDQVKITGVLGSLVEIVGENFSPTGVPPGEKAVYLSIDGRATRIEAETVAIWEDSRIMFFLSNDWPAGRTKVLVVVGRGRDESEFSLYKAYLSMIRLK